MKILVISPYLPHPKSGHGGGVLIYDILNHLSERHDVALLSFVDEREKEFANDLLGLKYKVRFVYRQRGLPKSFFAVSRFMSARLIQLLGSFLLWEPFYVSKFRHTEMAHAVEDETLKNNYDIIQIEYAQMGQYYRHVKKGKIVLHDIDVMFRTFYRRYKKTKPGPQKLFSFVEWCRWSQYEPKILRKLDRTFTLTEQDMRLVNRFYKITNVSHCPVGIEERKSLAPYSEREPSDLIFVGSFDHEPNVDAAVWLCEEIFPALLKKFPEARLNIIGKNPPQKLINASASLPSVKILGFVDNIDVYMNSCSAFIAPLRFGGGIKTKILTAMSYGAPVITTPIGAEGIIGKEGVTHLIGQTAEQLLDHIIHVFNDQSFGASLSEAAFRNVSAHYSWRSLSERLDGLYESVLSGILDK